MTRLVLLCMGVVFLLGAFLVPPDKTRTEYGEDYPLGEGFLRSFVSFNEDNVPMSLGVELNAMAMMGLPDHAEPPSFEHALHLPDGVAVVPFDHFSIDWVPHGHEPHGIYDRPHFDFHFYMISDAERDLIFPTDEAFAEKSQRAPDSRFMPAGYVSPPGNQAVPRMGAHLVDLSSPEFDGMPFTSTFIWGSYDGNITFMEPMVTREFLLSLKDGKGMFSKLIPQPGSVQKSGYYPASYSLGYDAERDAYRLSLDELQWIDAEG